MKKLMSLLLAGLLLVTTAATAAAPYANNRAPLREKPFVKLPLGAIRAEGWLRDQLQRQADGLTGHLDSVYPEVMGPRNGWLGGDGDVWERGPYWIDGLPAPGSSGRSAAGSPTAISARRKTVRSKARPYSATTPATGGPRWSCSRCCNNTTRRRATSASSN